MKKRKNVLVINLISNMPNRPQSKKKKRSPSRRRHSCRPPSLACMCSMCSSQDIHRRRRGLEARGGGRGNYGFAGISSWCRVAGMWEGERGGRRGTGSLKSRWRCPKGRSEEEGRSSAKSESGRWRRVIHRGLKGRALR